MTPLETTCLEFCIELLNQKTKVQEYESPLVCTIAVLGWGELGCDAADDDLGMILEDEGYAEGAEPIPSSPLSSLLSSSAHAAPICRIPRSWRLLFQAGVDWMVQQFIVYWWTFGLKIHYNTTTPRHIDFTIGQFRGFIHGVLAIPWDQLFDNPTEGTPGWSFLQDPRTLWPVAGGTWLVDRLAWELAVAWAFITQGAVSLNKLQKYFQQVARFKEKLALAMHLTSGAPQCNIFIKDGMVVFVTAYHKGFHATNDLTVTGGPPAATNPPAHCSPYVWGPDVGTGQEWSSERLWEAEQEQEMAAMEAGGDPDGIGDIADKQAGHTPHVAGMIYGWESTKLTGGTMARRLQFWASSIDWHQFLGFPDITHPNPQAPGNGRMVPLGSGSLIWQDFQPL
ncbi:hypothetical protein BDW68DRAFT_194792 [Aspergillus falconensis]